MMGIDQARAGEGIVSSYKKKKDEEEEKMAESPDLFQSKEEKLKVQIPDGWREAK